MRYDELKLPLGATGLHMTFDPRLTVLAGLTGPQRSAFVDAIARLNRAEVPGGSVTLVDTAGRRHVVDDRNAPDPTVVPPRNHAAWKGLLSVGAQELGLPRATDDPGRVAAARELDDARREAEQVRLGIDEARRAHGAHADDVAALVACEDELAALGTEADRHRHNRARALVELEQRHASLAAVDAPTSQIARDERLLDTTEEIQRLADDWASVGRRLDHIRGELEDLGGLVPAEEDDDLTRRLDVPDDIPAQLTTAIAERDRLRQLRHSQKSDLERLLATPAASTPADSRVLALAALDQETLWLTHRDVVLTIEALEEAKRNEAERLSVDPDERERIDRLHAESTAAAELAERRWLPSVLTATVTACSAALLLFADLWPMVTPLLLAVCLSALVVGVALPRVRARRAHRAEAAALRAVDASDHASYTGRFNEDPDSVRWQRAERIIEDYQHAQRDWHELVGTISPEDATRLEPQVHAWVAENDRSRQARAESKLRRELSHTTAELERVTRLLQTLLEPFGLDPRSEGLATSLQDRVLAGRRARLQVELGDAEETETKITRRLEAELETIGYEDGSLTARIATFGHDLDAARLRDRLRRDAEDRAVLVARIEELESSLDAPAPTDEPASDTLPDPDPQVTALRERRDRLARRVAVFDGPDLRELERRRRGLDVRIATLETALATDHGVVVANPVDHLVETLVKFRPSWPTPDESPAPAFLDDPFAAVSPALKRQLLDAVVEVTQLVQVVLLTDDAATIAWAREAEASGHVSVIAPTSSPRDAAT